MSDLCIHEEWKTLERIITPEGWKYFERCKKCKLEAWKSWDIEDESWITTFDRPPRTWQNTDPLSLLISSIKGKLNKDNRE